MQKSSKTFGRTLSEDASEDTSGRLQDVKLQTLKLLNPQSSSLAGFQPLLEQLFHLLPNKNRWMIRPLKSGFGLLACSGDLSAAKCQHVLFPLDACWWSRTEAQNQARAEGKHTKPEQICLTRCMRWNFDIRTNTYSKALAEKRPSNPVGHYNVAKKKKSKGTRKAAKHHPIRTERWWNCAWCMKLLTITIDGHLSAVQITMELCPEIGTNWLEPATIEAETKGYVVTCCSLHKVLSTAQSTFKWKSWHVHAWRRGVPQNTEGSGMM